MDIMMTNAMMMFKMILLMMIELKIDNSGVISVIYRWDAVSVIL